MKRRAARSAIAWLLAVLAPFQVMTAVYLDAYGVAHVHVDAHGAPPDPHGVRAHARERIAAADLRDLGARFAAAGDPGHRHAHAPATAVERGLPDARARGADPHVHGDARDHAHAHPAGYAYLPHDIGHTGLAPHVHAGGQVERHYHLPGDATVVAVQDGGLLALLAVAGDVSSGWSGSMLVAVPTAGTGPRFPMLGSAPIPWQGPVLSSRVPPRPERPPTISLTA